MKGLYEYAGIRAALSVAFLFLFGFVLCRVIVEGVLYWHC